MALSSPNHLSIFINRHSASENVYTSKLEPQEGKRRSEKRGAQHKQGQKASYERLSKLNEERKPTRINPPHLILNIRKYFKSQNAHMCELKTLSCTRDLWAGDPVALFLLLFKTPSRPRLKKAKNPGCAHRGLETSFNKNTKNDNTAKRREGAVQSPLHVNEAKFRHVLDHKQLTHDRASRVLKPKRVTSGCF